MVGGALSVLGAARPERSQALPCPTSPLSGQGTDPVKLLVGLCGYQQFHGHLPGVDCREVSQRGRFLVPDSDPACRHPTPSTAVVPRPSADVHSTESAVPGRSKPGLVRQSHRLPERTRIALMPHPALRHPDEGLGSRRQVVREIASSTDW